MRLIKKKRILKEFQKNPMQMKKELFDKISEIVKENKNKIDSENIEDFIESNYDYLDKNLEGIDSKILINKISLFNNSLTESIKKILKEDKQMEALDKESLFQDLAGVSGSLSDCFASLYTYKSQYIDNPKWKSTLSELRIMLSDTLSKTNSLMSSIGLQNDIISEE